MTSCIIPARGGSKRIPRKNIKDFWGVPIIAYSIQTALRYGFDIVAVSTDDDEIADVSRSYGAEVLRRSDRNSTDDATDYDVLTEVLRYVHADYLLYLYPVAPMVTTRDLRSAHNMCLSGLFPVVAAKGEFYWIDVQQLTPNEYYHPHMIRDEYDVDTAEDWEQLRVTYAVRFVHEG